MKPIPCFRVILLLAVFVLMQGVSAQDQPRNDRAKTVDDSGAVTIMARHCAGCHQAADHPGAVLLNVERLSQPETVRLLRKLIDTEQMPPIHQDFKSSSDGKALLRWLQTKEKSLKK